jgi:hypothetical protein
MLQLSIIITCLKYTPSVREYKPTRNFTTFFSAGDSKKGFDKKTYCVGGYVLPHDEMGPMMKWVEKTYFLEHRGFPKLTVSYGNKIVIHDKLSTDDKNQARVMQQFVDNLLPVVSLRTERTILSKEQTLLHLNEDSARE